VLLGVFAALALAVLRNGLMLSLGGIAVGIAAAAATTRLMKSLLHGDPATFAAVAIGLSLVALRASLVPAWRATRVDPVVALKTE
jgi:ABC-type antimicrobial peptide transport system permease subunit